METPGMVCLLLCVSIDAVKRAEEFSCQMLAVLLIPGAAASAADVGTSCRRHVGHTPTSHKLQHRNERTSTTSQSNTRNANQSTLHLSSQSTSTIYIHILLTAKRNFSV
jgi:hypothetical protein